MGFQIMIHPCIYAQGNLGRDAYICKKTGFNCTAQFFCHNENYWKPMYQIKCPDFSQDKVPEKNETEEQSSN